MFLKKKALLATIPSDSHSWNMVFMEFFLEENGYSVTNLGPNTPIQDIEDALYAEWFDLAVISSVNGHAYIEGKAIAQAITEKTDFKGRLLLGGKICTKTDPDTIHQLSSALQDSGFDAVFDDSIANSFDSFQELLSQAPMPLSQAPLARQATTA